MPEYADKNHGHLLPWVLWFCLVTGSCEHVRKQEVADLTKRIEALEQANTPKGAPK